jgi:hypothetical protein
VELEKDPVVLFRITYSRFSSDWRLDVTLRLFAKHFVEVETEARRDILKEVAHADKVHEIDGR